MGRQLSSFGLSALTGYDHYIIGQAKDLHRGDSIFRRGSAPSPKKAHSDIGSPQP